MLYLCRFNVDSEDEHPVVITKSGRIVFVLRILINKWKVKILKKKPCLELELAQFLDKGYREFRTNFLSMEHLSGMLVRLVYLTHL